jgi:hypothetical protein
MTIPRYTDSLLRQLINFIPSAGSMDPKSLVKRFVHLWRALEPEDEFALILSWLGKCRLVHKLSQEQLPLDSTAEYSVPDLFAVFDYRGRSLPVLIEVKTSAPRVDLKKPAVLSGLKPGYFRYAETLGLPMLIAWRHLTFWTLFDMHQATLAKVNYKMDFNRAMEENLLSELAGDFSYRVVPGSAIRMRIEKLSPPDDQSGFEGRIKEICLVNKDGKRVPEIPHLSSLFLFLDDDVELFDKGSEVVQSFVIRDTGVSELASRTLSKIVEALAAISGKELDWRSIIHDIEHWAHGRGEFRETIDAAAKYGVVDSRSRRQPKHQPAFLGCPDHQNLI